MKTIVFVDEITFEETEYRFDTFHYSIAQQIQQSLNNTTPIMTNKSGDQLIVGVKKERSNGEQIAETYKIIIEKLI